MRWLIGYGVSLVGGAVLVGILLKLLRRGMDTGPPWAGGPRIPPVLTGLIERTFFTTAVAFEISGVAVAMIAWIATKLGANWGSPETEGYEHAIQGRFTAVLAGIVSMFFALVGGVIARGA